MQNQKGILLKMNSSLHSSDLQFRLLFLLEANKCSIFLYLERSVLILDMKEIARPKQQQRLTPVAKLAIGES